ncbi:MAG: GNAT family N-acetyltransferase, partial [Beijerinckiaceae bacterium]
HAGPSLLGMGAASDAGFAVTCLTGAAVVESLATLGDTMQAATPFQSLFWLQHWYAAFSRQGAEPLLVVVRQGEHNDPVLLLPLVRTRAGRQTVISFADNGVTDYNAPLMRAGMRLTDPGVLLDSILRALPRADLLLLDKMPALIGAMANPLAADRRAAPAQLYGNFIVMGDRFDDYIAKFDTKFRKEAGRIKRVFEAFGDARFVAAATGEEAMPILMALEDIQRARMDELTYAYDLDRPEKRDFYRELVRDGIADGSVSLTALTVKGEVIAALLCVNRDGHCAMIRLAQGGREWSACSPGRLMILETMRHLHARGFRTFDMTIGAYEYKRRLNADHLPLVCVTAALSLRGQFTVTAQRLRNRLRAITVVRDLVRRLRGQTTA